MLTTGEIDHYTVRVTITRKYDIIYSMDAGIGTDLNLWAYYDDFRNTEEGRDT